MAFDRLPLLLAAMLLLSHSTFAAPTFGPFAAYPIRVIDGDTFVANVQIWPGLAATTSIRLSGINAPEVHTRDACEKAAGQKARDRLTAILNTGAVTLRDVRRGKYAGRVLARVIVNGEDVGQVLVREGLAKPYHGGKRLPWCP